MTVTVTVTVIFVTLPGLDNTFAHWILNSSHILRKPLKLRLISVAETEPELHYSPNQFTLYRTTHTKTVPLWAKHQNPKHISPRCIQCTSNLDLCCSLAFFMYSHSTCASGVLYIYYEASTTISTTIHTCIQYQ